MDAVLVPWGEKLALNFFLWEKDDKIWENRQLRMTIIMKMKMMSEDVKKYTFFAFSHFLVKNVILV